VLGMLVISHGRLAEDLVQAAQTIVGPIEGLEAVSIGWNDDVEAATRAIAAAIRRVDRGGGVLLLTDMFGGTPTNLGLALHEPGRVEIVTGVNLPMVIRFANLKQEVTLHDAAGRIATQGREAIHVASDVLERRPVDAERDGA
jgi:PTS system mannose-specific IIA component